MASEASAENQSTRGWGLVAIQAALFLAVAVTALLPSFGPMLWSSLWLSLALVVVGGVGVVLAGRDLGSALTPNPVPNGKGMVAAGVYRRVRHPMYTALVVICLGVGAGAGKVSVFVAVAALAVFFAVKARAEERYLLGAYPDYAEYGRGAGRFVPGIGRFRGV